MGVAVAEIKWQTGGNQFVTQVGAPHESETRNLPNLLVE